MRNKRDDQPPFYRVAKLGLRGKLWDTYLEWGMEWWKTQAQIAPKPDPIPCRPRKTVVNNLGRPLDIYTYPHPYTYKTEYYCPDQDRIKARYWTEEEINRPDAHIFDVPQKWESIDTF